MTRRKIIRILLISLGMCVLFALSGGILFYWIVPFWAEDPLAILAEQTPVRVFTDRNGNLLYVKRTYEGQWRFHVPLEEISPIALTMILAVEDRNFYRHSGVDFTAIFRAIRQNFSSGKVISGASTISMQLASMSITSLPRRSLKRKLLQVLRARRLEMCHSKKKILEEYVNRIPMGGNMYGLESGARYYFGRKAADLNESESALLCGLPQRPNAWRPDRHLQKAVRRRDLVLYILARQKILTPEQVRKIKKEKNLRFRSFAWPADFMELTRSADWMYFACAAKEAKGAYRISCAYQPEQARALREILSRCRASLPGVTSASGMILENSTGQVTALVGSVEDPRSEGSQINGAFMLRCAGSALKPFLYGEAASGGMLVDDTVLRDLPVRYGNYVPANFDGRYRGEVPAWEALTESLNIPAIRLAAELGEERIMALFRSLALFDPGSKQEHSGLSLALGSAGHTLYDICNAYRVFSRDGIWQPCTFLIRKKGKEPVPSKRIFVPGTGSLISNMLSRRMLPYSITEHVSWKTGTSNGNRDAWCFAWTSKWTVGVWFGNKDNRSSSALNGFDAAAPAAGRIISFLHSASDKVEYAEHYEKTLLCRESGLRAGKKCKETFESRMLALAPLRRCPHKEKTFDFSIRTPVPGKYYVQEGQTVISLTLECNAAADPYWILNGKILGRFRSRRMDFGKGAYTLRAVPEQSDVPGKSVYFTVE